MNKKGFTLIELLGVVIVLAVIALIITPIIGRILKRTEKSAYQDSVYELMEAAQLYYLENLINDNGGDTIFHCNGNVCKTENGEELKIKGEVPISGTITVDSDGKERVDFLSNGEYCADGTRQELRVERECLNKDTTEPVVEEEKITYTSTTSTITVFIPEDFAVDVESGMKSYKVTIDGKTKEVLHTGDTVSVTFEGLTKDHEYEVVIEAINRSDLSSKVTLAFKTVDFENPEITLTSNPETAINGYVRSEKAKITYDKTSVKEPNYFIKTTKVGTSNVGIREVCGDGVEPTDCSEVEEITLLEANTWYKVTNPSIEVIYDSAIETNETLYVIVYDGTNYSGTSTATLTKIKEEVNYTLNHYLMNVNGSGYTLQETEKKVGRVDEKVTPDVKTYTGFTAPGTQSATVTFDESTVINYYYTRNQYTVTVNRGTGIASVSGGGKKYYGSTVTVGASATAGYHFTGWSGYTTSGSFTMPAQDVSMTANGAANTYYITYAANGGSGSMGTTTCTYGTTCYLAGLGFSRSGYTFGGWSGSNGGSYSNGQGVANLTTTHGGTITMTARWNLAQQSYTITYGSDVTFRHPIDTTGYSSIVITFQINPGDNGNDPHISLYSSTNDYNGLVAGGSTLTYALNGRNAVYLEYSHFVRNGNSYSRCNEAYHTVTVTLIP